MLISFLLMLQDYHAIIINYRLSIINYRLSKIFTFNEAKENIFHDLNQWMNSLRNKKCVTVEFLSKQKHLVKKNKCSGSHERTTVERRLCKYS